MRAPIRRAAGAHRAHLTERPLGGWGGEERPRPVARAEVVEREQTDEPPAGTSLASLEATDPVARAMHPGQAARHLGPGADHRARRRGEERRTLVEQVQRPEAAPRFLG